MAKILSLSLYFKKGETMKSYLTVTLIGLFVFLSTANTTQARPQFSFSYISFSWTSGARVKQCSEVIKET